MTQYMNLVTTFNFRGKEFVVNLNPGKHETGIIEIKITDKRTLEAWLGTYDASYIENLTKKTGNFKRFDTFISMLKSGLLNTSHCVSLDLMTFEDLELLRNRATQTQNFSSSNKPHTFASTLNNRRYLIVTYTVEFDRIHYPLAMEYCGPPDPKILQETIHRLEKQVVDLEHQLRNRPNDWEDITGHIDVLKKKVVDVTTENYLLKEQIKKLNYYSNNQQSSKEIEALTETIFKLESKLKFKCNDIDKLKKENTLLLLKLEETLKADSLLKTQLNALQFEHTTRAEGRNNVKRFQSPSPGRNRSLDNIIVQPFRRNHGIERKVRSARSSFDVLHSSSEESIGGLLYCSRGRPKQKFMNLSSNAREISPTLSDLSHNSDISRCACKNCLHHTKFAKISVDNPDSLKKRGKNKGKVHLLKRIQSLEKIISGISFN